MNLNQSWPQQPVDDLRVDMGFRENLISESLNAKFAGILPEGVYRGFDVTASQGGFDIDVGAAINSHALVEIRNPDKPAVTAALTVTLPANKLKSITVAAGVLTYIVLEVYYRAELLQDESHKTRATIKAVTSLADEPHTRQLVLATVNAPANAETLTQEHITLSRKIDLATEQISDSYEMTESEGTVKHHPETGPYISPTPYVVGFGNGALMGRFSLLDTFTGGALEFIAIRNTKTKKSRLNLIAKSDDFPATRVTINEVGGRIEVQVHLYYENAINESMYVELKAYDAHNDGGIGWVKAFEPITRGEGDIEASLDISGNSGMGSSGSLLENGNPLADSYLAVDGKAKDSVKADLASIAMLAKNATSLGGFPASQFGVFAYTPSNEDLRPPLETDPDTLFAPKAVIKHPKMPTSNEPYDVETTAYGSSSSAYRIQVATVFSDGDDQQDKLTYKRWLSGDYVNPLASAWKPELNPSDYRKQASTRADTAGELLLSGTEVISKKALSDGRVMWCLNGYRLGSGSGRVYIVLGEKEISGIISIYSGSAAGGRIEVDCSKGRYIMHGSAKIVRRPRLKTTMDGVSLKKITIGRNDFDAIEILGVGSNAEFRFTGEIGTVETLISNVITLVASSSVSSVKRYEFNNIRPNRHMTGSSFAPPYIPASEFGVEHGGFNAVKLVGELYYWSVPNANANTNIPDRVLFGINGLPNLSDSFLNSPLAARYGQSGVCKSVRVYIPAIPYVLGSSQKMKPYADIVLFFRLDGNGDWEVVLNGYFSQESLATTAPFLLWGDDNYTMTVKRLTVVPADAKAVF